MASEERKILEAALKPLMKQLGFKKNGPTWYRHTDIGIQVLNIQGSQWDKSFYINLGVYFLAIGSEEKPKEHQCHVRQRLCQLSDDLQSCNDTLSFESDTAHEVRGKALCHLVKKFGIPWLERLANFEGARTYLSSNPRQGFPVAKATYEYLGIQFS